MTTTARIHRQLLARLENLCVLFNSALNGCEVRDSASVSEAQGAFMRWASEGWKGGEHALVNAWEEYIISTGEWIKHPGEHAIDFPLTAQPPWEFSEFYLVIGSVFANQALANARKKTVKHVAIAAMLYTDAVEAWEAWKIHRGAARARDPHTIGGVLHAKSLAIDDRIAAQKARSETARTAAKERQSKDPKQAAKVEALRLWHERHLGMHPKLRTVEQFAAEVMRRWPVLTSAKVICGWSAQWTKAVKADQTPVC